MRNGDPNGYPGCVNLSFAYVEGESLLMALKVFVDQHIIVGDILTCAFRTLPSHLAVLVHLLHWNHHTCCVP